MALTFACIQDLVVAEKIWQSLSNQQTLCDDWDFRYLFYKKTAPEIFFWTAYDGDIAIGLLPLQWNEQIAQLEFFGGRFMYGNHIFTTPGYEAVAAQLLDQVDRPAQLPAIALLSDQALGLPISEYLYTINLAQITTFEEYLAKTLNSKHRSNLKRKIKLAEAYGITSHPGTPEDLETLMALNLKTFGNESSFNKPFRQEIFRELLTSKFKVHLLSFKLDEKTVAASLAIFYNGTYSYLNLGAEREQWPHLGTLVSYQNFQQALSLGAHTFDAGLDDLGWKESWGMIKTPQYQFTKPQNPA